jgi:hypothetical protein
MKTIINISLLNLPGSIPVFSVHSIYGDDITKDCEILVDGSNVKVNEIKSATKLAIADSSGISIISAAFSKSQIGYIKFKHELTTMITVSCGDYDDSVNPPAITYVTTNTAGPGEIRVGGFTGSNGHKYASRMLTNPSGTTNLQSFMDTVLVDGYNQATVSGIVTSADGMFASITTQSAAAWPIDSIIKFDAASGVSFGPGLSIASEFVVTAISGTTATVRFKFKTFLEYPGGGTCTMRVAGAGWTKTTINDISQYTSPTGYILSFAPSKPSSSEGVLLPSVATSFSSASSLLNNAYNFARLYYLRSPTIVFISNRGVWFLSMDCYGWGCFAGYSKENIGMTICNNHYTYDFNYLSFVSAAGARTVAQIHSTTNAFSSTSAPNKIAGSSSKFFDGIPVNIGTSTDSQTVPGVKIPFNSTLTYSKQPDTNAIWQGFSASPCSNSTLSYFEYAGDEHETY